jgi:hypothetical protein
VVRIDEPAANLDRRSGGRLIRDMRHFRPDEKLVKGAESAAKRTEWDRE